MIEDLASLARGPTKGIYSYKGYLINGFRFHTKRRQRQRKTQNNGVVVEGEIKNGKKEFYSVLEE